MDAVGRLLHASRCFACSFMLLLACLQASQPASRSFVWFDLVVRFGRGELVGWCRCLAFVGWGRRRASGVGGWLIEMLACRSPTHPRARDRQIHQINGMPSNPDRGPADMSCPTLQSGKFSLPKSSERGSVCYGIVCAIRYAGTDRKFVQDEGQ